MAENLTVEQIAEIKETFSLFDKTGSGSVSIEEMAIIFRSLGQTPTEADMENMKAEADQDGLGTIEYSEMLNLFARYMKEPVSAAEILSAFEELDERKKGTITVKRFRHLLSTCGEALTEEEIHKMV